MKFYLKASYQTGNSFGSEDAEYESDFFWTNPIIARRNLRRLNLQYIIYRNCDGYKHNFWYHSGIISRRFKDKQLERYLKKNEYIFADRKMSYSHYQIYLIDDMGVKHSFSSPWIGYFESLDHLEITGIQIDDEGIEDNFLGSARSYEFPDWNKSRFKKAISKK